MNIAALKWAGRQACVRPTAKLVLLALAHHANPKGLAWPSIAAMAEFTGIHRKGVMREIKSLAYVGLIEDSRERRGTTGQIKVWRLATAQESFPLSRKSSRAGTLRLVPKNPTYRDSLFEAKESLSGKGSSQGRKSPSGGTRKDIEGSDTNVSGASADPVKQIFDLGVTLLTDTGLGDRAAHSLIGKWRKGRTDGEILTGLIECRARAISDPAGWLSKRFRTAHYVSASGYEYRGTRDQVKREAEKRHDMGTYWSIMGEERQEAEAAASHQPAPG